MRIYLALEHLIFIFVLLLFVFDLLLHHGLNGFGKIVDGSSYITEFVIPFGGRIS